MWVGRDEYYSTCSPYLYLFPQKFTSKYILLSLLVNTFMSDYRVLVHFDILH